jgi:uncharacterized protein (DUF342 family)
LQNTQGVILNQESTIVGLAFYMDADGETLLAEYTPVDNWHPIDLLEIRDALTNQGLQGVLLNEPALEELIKKYGRASQSFALAIGQCKDAVVEVTVSADKMSAYLTLIPPSGGKNADRARIEAALNQAKVVEGLLDNAIEGALMVGMADGTLVAQGVPVINGTDAQFHSLLPDTGDRSPRVDESGTVDYRELGQFSTVKVGDPLMERIPATAGSPGKNVLGEVIMPKRGKDYTFAKGIKGAAPSPRNHDMLVAEIAGQPIPIARGVKVEPTLSVKGIDLSTGNLEFEGSVNIASDVKSGMKIRVSGDLIIGGTVEAAEIHANGNISIRGGVIGHGEKANESSTRQDVAHITSGGTITALFVENARIEAGDSIIITEVAKQSELIAGNHVIVGREGSRKGHIVGGSAHASQLIKAVVAGSPAGLRTEIKTGLNPQLQSSFYAVEIRLDKLQKDLAEVSRALGYARGNAQRVAQDILHKAEKTHEKLEQEIENCELEKEELENRLQLADNARVMISKQIYGNVTVHVGHQAWQVRDDRSGGTFRIIEGEITFEAL